MTGFTKTLNKLRERLPTAVDVLEDGDEVLVVVELPGFEKDRIDLRLVGGSLEIEAERERDMEGYVALREERPVSVSKSVPLPVAVESEDASAEYRNGLLRVWLPKTEPETPRSREELEALSYGELQEVAREVGVKSNVTRNEMVETIAEELGIQMEGTMEESGEPLVTDEAVEEDEAELEEDVDRDDLADVEEDEE